MRLAYWCFEGENLFSDLERLLIEVQANQDTDTSWPTNLEGNGEAEDNRHYADLHSYQVARPTQKILSVARNLSSQAVISELYHLFFEKDLEQDKVRGLELAI